MGCPAYAARPLRIADSTCDLSVACRRPVGDLPDRLPNSLFIRGPLRGQRQVEPDETAGKVGFELGTGLLKQRRGVSEPRGGGGYAEF